MLFLRDIALARNSANLRICPLRSLFAMLLRDVVWLGIASKLSLPSLCTTLLRDVVWLCIASMLSLPSLCTTLLRDVVWLGIASKLSLLSPCTTSRSFSSRFGFTLPPILGVEPERRQSEPRAKAEWRQSERCAK